MIPLATNGWDQITTGLFMGGHDKAYSPDAPFDRAPVVVRDEFDCVISLYQRDGYGPADGVEHHHLRIPDGRINVGDVAEVKHLADIAADRLNAGKTVLIRCQAGLNRSGLVTALTLMRLGYRADDAIAEIRDKRSPHALFNRYFVAYLLSCGDAGEEVPFDDVALQY